MYLSRLAALWCSQFVYFKRVFIGQSGEDSGDKIMAEMLIPLVVKEDRGFSFTNDDKDIDRLALEVSSLSWGQLIALMQKVCEVNDHYLSFGDFEDESFAVFME